MCDVASSTDSKPQCKSLRNVKQVNIETFTADIQELVNEAKLSTADAASHGINTMLEMCLEKHAPLKNYKQRTRPSEKWMTKEVLEARSKRRRLERQFKDTKLTVHKEMFTSQVKQVNHLINQAKSRFYTDKLQETGTNQKDLYNMVARLTSSCKKLVIPSTIPVSDLPTTFANYFTEKIAKIRATFNTNNHVVDTPISPVAFPEEHLLEVFPPTSVDEVTKVFRSASIKTSDLDPLPQKLLSQIIDVIVPSLVNLINLPFSTGIFPQNIKQATITPLLKNHPLTKSNLRTTDQCPTCPSLPSCWRE
jgi:hypothetical protein